MDRAPAGASSRSGFKRTVILAQGETRESRSVGRFSGRLFLSLSRSLTFRIARIEFIRLGPCARLVHQPVIINRAFLCAPSLPLDLNTLSYTRDATYRTGYLCYYTIARIQKSRTDGGNGGIYDCTTSISVLQSRGVCAACVRLDQHGAPPRRRNERSSRAKSERRSLMAKRRITISQLDALRDRAAFQIIGG